jgi:hypothetical protein
MTIVRMRHRLNACMGMLPAYNVWGFAATGVPVVFGRGRAMVDNKRCGDGVWQESNRRHHHA